MILGLRILDWPLACKSFFIFCPARALMVVPRVYQAKRKRRKKVQLETGDISKPELSLAWKSRFLRAQAEQTLDIQLIFKPEPSLTWNLSLLWSQTDPPQLKLFGMSQLKLKQAFYTLSWVEINKFL